MFTVGRWPEARVPVLKLGLLVDDPRQQRWILETLAEIRNIAGVRIQCVVTAPRPRRPDIGRMLHCLVDGIDYVCRCWREPLFRRGDLVRFLDVPCRTVAATSKDGRWCLDAAACRLLRRNDIDLWLCIGHRPLQLAEQHICRYGVWGIELGEDIAASDAWAGAPEVAAQHNITAISVRDYARSNDGNVLLRHCAATDLHSVRRNRLRAVCKARHLIVRTISRLGDGARRVPPPPLPLGYPRCATPTVRKTALLVCSLCRRIAGNRLRALRYRPQWQIAYYFGHERVHAVAIERLRYLVPPADRFWADPMALEYDGRYFIFFEELFFGEWKGRLMAVEVFADRTPSKPCLVLERPYHLSYPFLFRWQGELYMVPESAGSRRVELYRCVGIPDRWQFERVLLENVTAYDATLWQQADRWWMFASIAMPGMTDGDELHLYSADFPTGPWTAHRGNPVVSDARYARPAGPLYEAGGKVYRPSQDCSAAYGYAITLNRVDTLDDQSYRETPVAQITPELRDDFLCVHTVGQGSALSVFDYQVLRARR